MYIIPAIDLLDRKVVRLGGGKYDAVTQYDLRIEDLLEQFNSNGTDFVQIIDLNGAKGDFSQQKYLLDILKKSSIKVQYGGGVRSIDKVKELIDAGFHRVIVGTAALTEEDFLSNLSAEICGKNSCSDQVIIAIDMLDNELRHSGWEKSSDIKPLAFIDKCVSLGYFRFLCTDIGNEGRMKGSNVSLYKDFKAHYPFIKLIAQGGISKMQDVTALQDANLEAVVIGKALYENKISVDEVKQWNLQALVNF
jgi:phosphoribosylformimino-5-aminoimidazole carboxamide ribotide isomerase